MAAATERERLDGERSLIDGIDVRSSVKRITPFAGDLGVTPLTRRIQCLGFVRRPAAGRGTRELARPERQPAGARLSAPRPERTRPQRKPRRKELEPRWPGAYTRWNAWERRRLPRATSVASYRRTFVVGPRPHLFACGASAPSSGGVAEWSKAAENSGGVAEWSKAADLKSAVPVRVPWVRILPPPPQFCWFAGPRSCWFAGPRPRSLYAECFARTFSFRA